jgi:hypothetical protein
MTRMQWIVFLAIALTSVPARAQGYQGGPGFGPRPAFGGFPDRGSFIGGPRVDPVPGLGIMGGDPGNPLDRLAAPRPNFGPRNLRELPGQLPGANPANPLDRDLLPGRNFNPMEPGVDPSQKQKDRDERNHPVFIPHGLHLRLPSDPPNNRPESDLHPPKSVPPEGVVSPAEFKYSPTKFLPAAGEGGAAISRGFSSWRGRGFLAGIGAALAALFKGLCGRRKES